MEAARVQRSGRGDQDESARFITTVAGENLADDRGIARGISATYSVEAASSQSEVFRSYFELSHLSVVNLSDMRRTCQSHLIQAILAVNDPCFFCPNQRQRLRDRFQFVLIGDADILSVRSCRI